MTSSTLCSSSLPCCPSAPCPAQALRKAAARSGGARGGLRAPSAVPAGSEPPGKDPGVGQGRILVPTIPSAALQGSACAPCLAAPRGHQLLLALCSPGDGDGQLRENCPCLMAAPPLGDFCALCRQLGLKSGAQSQRNISGLSHLVREHGAREGMVPGKGWCPWGTRGPLCKAAFELQKMGAEALGSRFWAAWGK